MAFLAQIQLEKLVITITVPDLVDTMKIFSLNTSTINYDLNYIISYQYNSLKQITYEDYLPVSNNVSVTAQYIEYFYNNKNLITE